MAAETDRPERRPPDIDEYAGLDPAVLAAAGWTPEELYWEELSAAGLALCGHEEAKDYWREAASAAGDCFAPHDPRRATSLANLALAEPARAEALLGEAVSIWDAAGSWAASLRPERRARSSLFHLRLMRKHEGGYDHWSQERHAALLAQGGERLALRRAGRLSEPAAYALWRDRRPAAFDDSRRLIGAVYLIAPCPPPEPSTGEPA